MNTRLRVYFRLLKGVKRYLVDPDRFLDDFIDAILAMSIFYLGIMLVAVFCIVGWL